MKKLDLTTFEGHLRPAQIGDICVLVEPRDQAQNQVREQQLALQRRFGGNLIERLHLTCQRFACDDPGQLGNLTNGLREVIAQIEPFNVEAVGFETVHVPIRETMILKWQTEVDQPLRQFVESVRTLLVAQGVEPHYAPGFIPNLVTALKDMPEFGEEELANETGLPYTLFETGRLVVSRILGPNEFSIECEVAW